jgi:hypothetical protein
MKKILVTSTLPLLIDALAGRRARLGGTAWHCSVLGCHTTLTIS